MSKKRLENYSDYAILIEVEQAHPGMMYVQTRTLALIFPKRRQRDGGNPGVPAARQA